MATADRLRERKRELLARRREELLDVNTQLRSLAEETERFASASATPSGSPSGKSPPSPGPTTAPSSEPSGGACGASAGRRLYGQLTELVQKPAGPWSKVPGAGDRNT